jgi:hypothetical protein
MDAKYEVVVKLSVVAAPPRRDRLPYTDGFCPK